MNDEYNTASRSSRKDTFSHADMTGKVFRHAWPGVVRRSLTEFALICGQSETLFCSVLVFHVRQTPVK